VSKNNPSVMKQVSIAPCFANNNPIAVERISKHQLIYSFVGFLFALICVGGGILLFLNGIAGSSSFTANFIGVETTIDDAAPGAILFIVGLFVIFFSKYEFNIPEWHKTEKVVAKPLVSSSEKYISILSDVFTSTEVGDITNTIEWSDEDQANDAKKRIKKLPDGDVFKREDYGLIRIYLKSNVARSDRNELIFRPHDVSGHFIVTSENFCILVLGRSLRYGEHIIPWENILYIDI